MGISSNPWLLLDPFGLEEICGPYVYLYTGSWCNEREVYEDAVDAAAEEIITRTKCWWNCEVTGHKCCVSAITGAVSVIYTHLPLPKLPGQVPIGSGNTTLLSQTASALKKIGCKETGQSLRLAARAIKSAPFASGAAVAMKGFLAGEAIWSISCSLYCSKDVIWDW